MILKGQLIDLHLRKIYPVALEIRDKKIHSIVQIPPNPSLPYLLPGFIDSHVHIESSMLVPSEFARLAVVHGTVATLSDPHEIANVCGMQGVEYMIDNGKQVPFHFFFGAPSCVPATPFETAGGEISAADIAQLMARPEILYLAEMMNWPGTVNRDPLVMEKIQLAQKQGKPIDGHAPGLRGDNISKYISAGISTDHECFTFEEGLEKLQKGMKVIIREGSAAKNFDALIDLVPEYFENMMFCSDDKHPDDLLLGHINQLCKSAISVGKDVFKVLQMACINPVKHYNLDVGILQKGDAADFIIVNNLNDLKVLETYIDGQLVAKEGISFIESVDFEILNNFQTDFKVVSDFEFHTASEKIKVIEALDGELVTNQIEADSLIIDGNLVSNTTSDILKMTVVNRYKNEVPAIAFIKNFGLKEGAIASSVGHDSHNIIAVGVSDEAICKAVNLVIKYKGGVCAVDDTEEKILPLPIAGIMSATSAEETGKAYAEIDKMAKKMGSTLRAPFMTLSFMSLLVIPSLKLSDKGLFDGTNFQFTSLEIK